MSRRPGDPVEGFPPVGLLYDLIPVDHPQYIPPSPHNLPPSRDRPAQRSNRFAGMLPSDVPTSGPSYSDPAPVREDHRYARLTESVATVGNAVSAIVLPEPTTRRNFLSFRNNSAAANIYVAFGRDASLQSVFRLTPNQILLFDTVVPQDDMYALADAAAAQLVYSYSTIAT